MSSILHHISNEFIIGGIHKAFLIDKDGDLRVFIPEIHSSNMYEVYSFGSPFNIDSNKLLSKFDILPKPMWNVPNEQAMKHEIPIHPCWVIFENNSIYRPVIMGWCGEGIMYHASNSDSSENQSGYYDTNGTFISTSDGENISVNNSDWLGIVRAVKEAVANQKPGYNQSGYITININGKSIKTRTDCSGVVSTMLQAYGSYSSGTMVGTGAMMGDAPSGFKKLNWSGWDSLQPGDILIRDGHTEVYAGSDKSVYNAGSTSSINNPGTTQASYSNYLYIWRPI